MKLVVTSILTGLLLMPNGAKALSGFGYFGISEQFNHFDGMGFADNVDVSGLTDYSYKQDDNGFGYRLFAGYQFNEYVALELGFGELGDTDFSLSSQTAGVAGLSGKSRTSVVDLRINGTYQISRHAFFSASVGVYGWDNEFSQIDADTSTLTSTKVSDKGQTALLGAGWGYAFSPKHAIRLELERSEVAESAVTNLVFSYMTKF